MYVNDWCYDDLIIKVKIIEKNSLEKKYNKSLKM